MNKLKKSSLAILALLIFIASVGCSGSDRAAEREADRLEDKADQIRKEDKEIRKANEKAGEAVADRKEEKAKQLRKSAEDRADQMEDDADRVRKATEK